jgi:ubiquinone/menaquinone biosynthesis C-methylase UbiE
MLNRSIRLFCESHFGRLKVPLAEKQGLVNQVFSSVSSNYDIMNDAMSLGIHRYWKNYFVEDLGRLGNRGVYNAPDSVALLDVAGGTGDIAFRVHEKHARNGVALTILDINASMLAEGKKKAEQLNYKGLTFVEGNA